MAQVQEIRLIDDLDGGEAHETVAFSLDGRNYEMDLSTEHATQLRDGVAPFIGAARRTDGRAKPGRADKQRKPTADREENQAIREWARAHQIEVSDRGRISNDVLEAYRNRAA